LDKQQKKEEIRERLLDKRISISEPEFYGASADIIEELKEQRKYQNADTVHCYVSMNKRREVATHELIQEMIFKGRRVIVPVTNFESGTLTHIQLTSFSDLEENEWGVLEPGRGSEVSPEVLELVIVPMVGGDEHCNRIGYGKGFYDRFLQNVDCPTIGLAFENTIIDQVPTEKFDIPLDKIITEKRILERN
jgi:5-formyltetrahydrofolate cyclo-ligase